ncbi:MAG: hypothetical protein QOH63_2914 [Acidobacteriota bacterium]|jgi:hypothetical protein|nr:hypothetical protein [Acidobacteriota bacterium]
MTASVLCLLFAFALDSQGQTPTPTPSPSPTPSPAPCAQPVACPTIAPSVLQVTATWQKDNKVTQLASKRFYLSPCPFNLEKITTPGPAPSRRSYYTGVKASPQLIKWLEANNCDTVYCRELRSEEVTCKTGDADCVPEFVNAYTEALRKLKNNADLARKWITNYAPLSSPELRTGFYTAKTKWLDTVVAAAEKASNLPPGTIHNAFTNKRGVAYFYDLCPGAYYVSNLAPIENEGEGMIWETTAIKIGKPDVLETTPVSLTNVPPKKRQKNNFVGKKVAGAISSVKAVD